jgi:23S rRNA pseudouridine2605 synthase
MSSQTPESTLMPATPVPAGSEPDPAVPVAASSPAPDADDASAAVPAAERRRRSPLGRRRRPRAEASAPAVDPQIASDGDTPDFPDLAESAADAVPLAESAGGADAEEGQPMVMAEQALDRDVLERGRRAAKQALNAQSDKLHKVLADAGIGSRRDMEELIVAGRVSVNGQPAHVGQRILPTDQIRINGKPLLNRRAPGKQPRVILYHKPSGEIVSQDDPQGRPSVFDRMPRISGGRWVAVGRLDFNTEGLLVLTTSGELANRLMHPRYEIEREYAVRIIGELTPEQREQLLNGVQLDDGLARFTRLEDAGGQGINHWYRAVISEGRNREVRRIFEALGMQVSRLIRIRFGSVQLPRNLARGRFQELTPSWVEAWVHDLGMATPTAGPRSGGDAARKSGGGAGRAAPGGRGKRPAKAGGGSRQPDPMTSTVNYIAQGGKPGLGAGRAAPGGRGKRPAKAGGGSRQPDPMTSTVNYIAQDAMGGMRRGRAGGLGGKPAKGGSRQPDPMTSTVNYIAQDAMGGMRRGRAGGLGGKPAKGGSRQPDPMTSTVNYIARGHGHGTGAGRGAGGMRRGKPRGDAF